MVLLEHTLPHAHDHRAGPRNAPARDTQSTTAGAAMPGAVNLAGHSPRPACSQRGCTRPLARACFPQWNAGTARR
jgi:hypothetical protein